MPREKLKATWSKRWAKEWAREHLKHVIVTSELVGTFSDMYGFAKHTAEPLTIKPNNATHSRGVVYVTAARPYQALWDREERRAKPFDKSNLRAALAATLDRPIDAYQWMLEPFIQAGENTRVLFSETAPHEVCGGILDPPAVFRAVIWKGRFHFGEIHVPTRASGGVGSLRKGAVRYVFDHTGKIVEPPHVNAAPAWIPGCDARADKELYGRWSIPGWAGVLEDLNERVIPEFGRRALYAFDFLVDEGGRPVFLEIEHSPNVKYLTLFGGFQ